MILDPVPEGAEAREYIKTNLTPTLVKGLAALCKEKPSAGKVEAVQWLADWLLANNPNKVGWCNLKPVLQPFHNRSSNRHRTDPATVSATVPATVPRSSNPF
jgi:hypothetical protein